MARVSTSSAVAAMMVVLAAAAAVAQSDNFVPGLFPNRGRDLGDHKHADPRTAGNKFVATVLGTSMMNNTFPAGQEVRLVVASAYAVNMSMHDSKLMDAGNIAPGGAKMDEMNQRVTSARLRKITSLLKMGNYTLLPAFNATGPSAVRVRVIAAHSSRTATHGAVVPCTAGASHDVWFEHWGMAPRQLVFGRHMLVSGFVTFTAPPFNFRYCVKNTQASNATRDGTPTDTGLNAGWSEFENQHGQYSMFGEPVMVWKVPSSTLLEAGDYTALEILGNAPQRAQLLSHASPMPLNISAFSLVDNVKLVPFGYPCTYEKEDSSTAFTAATTTTGTSEYCGANAVQASTGLWLNSNCYKEGAVTGGVARVGARSINPYATTSAVGEAKDSQWTATRTDRSHLIAYLKMPAAGQYDVCVSSRWWRRTAFHMSNMERGQHAGYARNAMPVWIKAYDASSSMCDSVRGYDTSIEGVASCQPRKTAVVVTAPTNPVSFSTVDDTPGTWGEIKFTSTGTLNYGAATQWDLSATRDYYNLTNGDMFRLVPEQYFVDTTAKTSGDLWGTTKIVTAQTFTSKTYTDVTRTSATYSNSGLLTTANTGTFKQYAIGQPDQGTWDTIESSSGCFWQGSDNYGATGHFGNPGTQCCSSAPCTTAKWCTMSDTGANGPTASADLGANPRVGYQPWALDGTGTTAWGYIRFPAAGTYRVCYKKAGTSNWQVLKGTQAHRTTSNATFVPKALNSGFTYHFNDSRGDTWGPVKVTSLSGNTLDKQAWNYYTASAATAVGSALKIVKTTESCYVSTAQSRTYSMNPGSLEAMNTLGSADDATTLTSMIYFYAKVPSYSTTLKYRICFRQADKNWHALADPNFAAHAYMTSSTEFGAFPSSTISFTLEDTQTGSWGKFIFNRSSTTTPSLNADSMNGDMFRIVPNETSAGVEVNCDRVWGTVTDLRAIAQKYDATMADSNLGLVCAVQSATTTDPCYTGNTMPTSNSVVSTTPYTDIIPGATVTGLRNLDATVGFITLPSGMSGTRPVGYKVCYKQARFTNWVEATNANGGALTVTAARTVTAAAPTGTVMSGQYTYVALTATTAFPVNVKYDLVKLVPFASTCEVAAVANAGYELYTAISGVNTFQCVVDATNSSQITSSCQTDITTTTARAYMTMPTVRNTAGGTMSSYRVCYMARTSTVSTQNWHDLSGTTAFTVKHHGITYTAMNKPYYNGMLRLKIASTSQLLNTMSGKDSAKLVLANKPCADTTSSDQPSTTTAASLGAGREVGYSTAGITDLMPTDSDETREAIIDTVLWSSVGSSYKVCYKPYGSLGWVEVLQADGSDRVYALTSDYIMPATAEVSSFTAAATLRGQYTDQPNYFTQAWTSVAVAGASGYDGTTHSFYVTYAATQTAGHSHKVKFVESYRESPAGTYTATGSNCFSEGVEHMYTTAATTSGLPAVNLPLKGAKYTVCVWVSASSTWYQAPSSGGVSQPMTVVENLMGFSAEPTTGVVTVFDNHAANGTSFGGLAGGDYVYIINATGSLAACGSVADYTGTAVATAKMNLTTSAHGADTTNFLAVRMATLTLPTTPRTGSYAVCVQRTQAAATNASGFTPFAKANWYHIGNVGAQLGGGSQYLAVSGASKLNISGCPVYNTSYKLRSGSTFDITVRAEDANHNVVDYALGTKRYGITAVGTGYSLQVANGECSQANAATYGYASSALTQYMDNGRLKFSLTSLSACPAGGCTLSFAASSSSIASSAACTFDVQPTTVAAVSFVTSATSCSMGSWCSFKVVAVHSDGGVAHTINSGVTITAAGWTSTSGTGMTATGSTFSLAGGSLNFVNGVASFTAKFEPSAYSTTASETVTLTASANGKTSPAVSFTVHRPILSAIHIVDVFPVATSGAPLPALLPTWEPTQTAAPYTMRGGDGIVLGSNTVSAATGYHMVAGQAYEVVFRAVVTTNAVTHYANTNNVVPSGFGISLDSTFATTLAASSNAVLRGSAASESDTGALSTTSWGQGETQKNIQMRFKNSGGCTTGCTVPFTFTGLSTITASITTPVRSVATKLTVVGCATSLTALASSTATTCTGVASTVNKGWYINVSAVDDFGNVDKYFDGDVVAVMPAAAEAAAMRMGVKLATVAGLAAGAAPAGYVKVTAVDGFATVALTVSRPCASGCEAQLMSTWGTNVATVGALVATPNTVRLQAKLNTVLAYCAASSTTECASVAGVSLANTTHAMSLIYKDTRVCMNVHAVDSNGDSTLYESNWIGYYARDITTGSAAQALTLTDDAANTGFVQRYMPLKNSAATFCFTISGFTSARDVQVSFVAQRFGTAATYWSHGSTGMATVGPLKVWPTKLVASVLLSSAAGGDVVTSGVAGSVSASYSGSAVALTLGFMLKDHYNNSIVPAEVVSTEMSKYLHFRTSSTGLQVTNLGSTTLRGTANVTLGAATVNVTSTTVQAAVTLSAPCLGCMITADLVDVATQTHQSVLTLASSTTAVYLGSNVTLYVVNQDASAVRKLAFNPSTSPLTSYWVNASAAPTTTTSNTAPTYAMTSCFTYSATCNPLPAALNLASCDARGNTYMGASATTALQMRVYVVPSASASAFPTTTAMEATGTDSQVDIMNTYTVAIGFGNQLLSCTTTYGAACANDNTAAPTQTLQAYGSTVRGAIGQFAGVADASIRTTSFFTIGLSTSTYLAVNSSTSKYDSAPSVGGAFTATATSATGTVSVSGVSMASGNAFYWRPADAPATVSLLATAADADACNDTAVYSCSGGTGCSTSGLAQTGSISTGLAFAYASHTPIPVGVAFPMTVEAHTSAAQRAVGASGTVAVTVDSWAGCNNGGAPTFSGTMANGRATVWITFATPCEACVLKFKVTPDSSAMWASMNAAPALLEAWSSAITATGAAQAASEVVATAATPATALTSTTTALTVATPVMVTLTPRAKVGNIPFATTASTTMVTMTPKVQTSGANWWWVGNGGVLRPSLTSANLFKHYQVGATAMTAATQMSAYFTRTCASCMITVTYKIGSGSATSFNLPSTFVVSTAASMTTLVGFVPRSVDAGKDVAIALWSTGSEDAATIPVAGVAPSTTVATAANPSFSVTVATNGDGGRLTSAAWVFNNTQIHRLSFSAPCDTCTVSVGGNTFAMRVFTQATHLRPGADATLSTEQIAMGTRRAATMVAMNDWRIVPVQAIDDMGFVDQSAGTSGCGFPARRFVCTWAPVYPSIVLTADGMSSSSFPVSGNADFFMGDQSGVRVGYNRMISGTVNYNYSFTTPQRNVIPVFTATVGSAAVTSALSATRAAFPVPKYSVSVGTSNLAISVASATPVASLTQNRANTFHVALVGTVATITGKKFVAVEADNAVTVSASAGCPAHTVNASGPALMAGYASFQVVFAAATDATTPCELTFAVGAGVGSCAASADCVSVQTVTVTSLVASTFDIVRPSAWEFFDGTVSGSMHAHAGRALRLRTAVKGQDALGNYVAVTDCATCTLTVTSSDCGFNSATATVTAGGAWAETSLTMADNGAATYTCSITVAMTGPNSAGTSTALTAMDRSSTSLTYTVTVCKSASVKLLTNTSETYRGTMLRTGVAYEFYAVMMTAAGTQCLGDSQDDATVLALSAVDGATGLAVPTLSAVNVNATSTTTAAYGMMNMAAAARTSVTAVGGGFKFHVVFTNSTVNLNMTGGVKVKIAAASLSSTVMSGAVDTVVAASRLAFGRMMFPSWLVKTRAIVTKHMGMNRSTAVSVMAVDGLPASWQEMGLMSGMPNVAAGATDFGNDARVAWAIAPAPSRTAAFPLSFTGGAASTTLAMGKTMWSSVTWNGNDGIYGLSVGSQAAGIAATPSLMVTTQTVRNIALETRGFTTSPVSAAQCTSSCVLPNGTFVTKQNATVNGGVAFLSIDSLMAFNLSVLVTDGSQPVIGDDDSVIAVTLNSNAGTSVQLGMPPAYVQRGTLYARVRRGKATFDLGFLGDTMMAGGVEQFASLSFSCPATRPAHLLMPGESAANPCTLSDTVTTQTFQVVDVRASASALNSAAVIAARTVIKAGLGLSQFQLFNTTRFGGMLAAALQTRGISYLHAGNIGRVLLSTSCTVDLQVYPGAVDLGATVCGANQVCSSPNNLASCPRGVLACGCPQLAARSLLLSRFLLQNATSGNGTKTRAEFTYELHRADTFPARTSDEVAAEYTRVQAATIDALQNDPELVNGFQIESVSERLATATVTTIAPTTTPAPPVVQPPAPPTVGTTVAPASAASPVTVALALAVAALLALFA